MKKISIIMPVKEEEKFLKKAVDSILQTTLPYKELELILVIAPGKDKSFEIAQKLAAKYRNVIKLVNNPYIYTPFAFNIGISQAEGEFILIVSAHAEYTYDYIRKLLDWFYKLDATVIGGPIVYKPCCDNMKVRAIACALSTLLGTGGAAHKKVPQKPILVEGVAFPFFKKDIISKFGGYDERLIKNQDAEFYERIRSSGGKIMLVPEPIAYYFPRASFKALFNQYYTYGLYRVVHSRLKKHRLKLRQLLPIIWSIYLLLFPFAIIEKYYLFPLITYLIFTGIFSFICGITLKSFKGVLYAFWTFLIIHFAFGLGGIQGSLKKLKNE